MHDVGLYYAARAVVESGSWLELSGEEQALLSSVGAVRVARVNGVSDAVCAKPGSEALGCSSLCFIWGHSLSDDTSESANSVFTDNFDSGYDVTAHELREIGEEWLASVLLVKLFDSLRSGETAHLQLRDTETVAVQLRDNLSSVSVTVRFDEGEGLLRGSLETVTGEDVTVLSDLELSGKHVDDGAYEEFSLSHSGTSHSLDEHPSVFDVVLKLADKLNGGWGALTISRVWSFG